MRRSNRYNADPYWTTARFDGIDAKGNPIRKGDAIFYYPRTRSAYVGAAADEASRDFDAAAFDEAMF